jgi:AraC-like DNA-binding protein
MAPSEPSVRPLRAIRRAAAPAVPIVRAAHLMVYMEVLRETGVPVERELARSRLPGWIEETPDAYVSLPLSLDWLARCCRDATVMELGFGAARRTGLDTLGRTLRDGLLAAPTGFARIEALAALARHEDSALDVRIRREGTDLRVVCDVAGFGDHPGLGFAEWLNLQALVTIVRSVAGPGWTPKELTFVAASPPPVAALEAFGDTRILHGRAHCSMLLPAAVLARACPSSGPARPSAQPDVAWDFAATLRSAIRPYLGDGHPDIHLAAEIAGTSTRTLQRRLADCGRSYSDLVQETRFDVACSLLGDRALRIIDVAVAAGYENPQHFSRAFRRVAGVTPSAWRAAAGGAG